MNTPLWCETELPKFAPARSPAQFDVVVIGGGITGLTAAALLKMSGRRVAVVERHHLAAGDTGNTTAHLTAVPDERISKLAQHFGKDAARLVWRGQMSAIATIEALATGHDCEFERVPGYLHLALDGSDHDETSLADDAELIREFGGDAEMLGAVPYFELPGIEVRHQAKFHPVKYLRRLAQEITSGEGCAIFENADVTEVRDDPLTVVVNDSVELTCDHVIVATHVPLAGKAGMIRATALQTKLYPHSSYVVGAKVAKGTVPVGLYWDTTDPYYYLRVEERDDHDYLIFGGCDHKTGQQDDTEASFRKLRAKLLEVVPTAQIDRQWSGQVVETNDGLPYIGETAKHQFIATGYAGNGMTFGTLAAMMACDYVLGRENPWAELFATNRKKVRGGTWEFLRENVDYPYYLLHDRVSRPDAKSIDEVRQGEGKLIDINGQRVACSRDEQGNLTAVSAVCTHMGCFVHWNNAERTWDCPCHGSRFLPNGEVLGGPAETPLEAVDISEVENSASHHA